jgi:exonuclease III
LFLPNLSLLPPDINAYHSLWKDGGENIMALVKQMRRRKYQAVVITEAAPSMWVEPSELSKAMTTENQEHWQRTRNHVKRQALAKYDISVITGPSSSPSHVVILVDHHFAGRLAPDQVWSKAQGRWLQIRLHFPHEQILDIIGIYNSAQGTTRVQQDLAELTVEATADLPPTHHAIICADTNEVLHPVDSSNPNRKLTTNGLLHAIEEDTPMLDSFRLQNPQEIGYTHFPSPNPLTAHPGNARIDAIFISPSLATPTAHVASAIDGCRSLLSLPKQDHLAVVTQLTQFSPLSNSHREKPPTPHPRDMCDYTNIPDENWESYTDKQRTK